MPLKILEYVTQSSVPGSEGLVFSGFCIHVAIWCAAGFLSVEQAAKKNVVGKCCVGTGDLLNGVPRAGLMLELRAKKPAANRFPG